MIDSRHLSCFYMATLYAKCVCLFIGIQRRRILLCRVTKVRVLMLWLFTET